MPFFTDQWQIKNDACKAKGSFFKKDIALINASFKS